MLAIYLSPLYIIGCIYVWLWFVRWLGACHDIFKRKGAKIAVAAVVLLAASSLPAGFFMPVNRFGRLVNSIANLWFGVFACLLLVLILSDVVGLIIKKAGKGRRKQAGERKFTAIYGGICLSIIAVICVYGAVNARIVRVTPYEVTIPKDGGALDDLNIVLAADLHLGYNIGCAQMEAMVEKINASNPDLVVIAGDIFDNNYDALEDDQELIRILGSIESTYGVYACYGNHDVAEPILAGFTFPSEHKKQSDERMDKFLEAAGITLLQDEGVLIENSFYLFGRADAQRPGRGIEVRVTPEEITKNMDLSKPVIVIDHEPGELEELSEAGVDLDLSGHTHDGQIFPANLLMKFLWENPCGYLQKGNMHSIVTSGVGLFGPDMRVGTKAEICQIHVNFL